MRARFVSSVFCISPKALFPCLHIKRAHEFLGNLYVAPQLIRVEKKSILISIKIFNMIVLISQFQNVSTKSHTFRI